MEHKTLNKRKTANSDLGAVRRIVTIKLPLDIAETLQGLIDGSNGSSEDEEFSRQMNIVLKKLDKAISKHYA